MNIKSDTVEFIKGMVSIVTPCYNGEKFLPRFLESVLSQTYSKIQLIITDDGSKDRTKDIILSYVEAFEENGYILEYLYQENAGQAAAINTGIQKVSGEFFYWCDSDDILLPDCIQMLTEALERNNKKFALAQIEVVNEDNTNLPTKILKRNNLKKGELFRDLINLDDAIPMAGAYMIRTTALLESLPDKKIIESRVGQNYQLLLPISLFNECIYIEKPVYRYVVRAGSHSHSVDKVQDKVKRVDEVEKLIYQVLDSLSDYIDNKKIRALLKNRSIRQKCNIMVANNYYDDAYQYWKKIRCVSMLYLKFKIEILIRICKGKIKIWLKCQGHNM